MSITDTALPRPPRAPYPGNPQDMERFMRELRDYLDRVYKALVQAAVEVSSAQPLSPTLTALDNLSATAGLVEQTGADTFTKRPISASTSASVMTRAMADLRYDNRYTSGPSTATDNAVARFNSTTGKLLQSGVVTIDDDGVMANHRIGAWTSNADAAVNGYVTVTDNAGNSRKLATIA